MKEKIGIFGCTADPFTLAHPIRGASAASSEEFPNLELPYDAEV